MMRGYGLQRISVNKNPVRVNDEGKWNKDDGGGWGEPAIL
jgi:hypothetical protein